MATKSFRVGLVLSGGGAKGAYHVGVIKYLADKNIQVDAVAGSSIGALNGTMVASSSNLRSAANNLEEIWNSLAAKYPLKINELEISLYLLCIFIKVLEFSAKGTVDYFSILKNIQALSSANLGLLKESPIYELFDKYLDWQKFQSGFPLYVSVYRSQASLSDLLTEMLATANLINTQPSEFLHLQSLEPEQQINALLASAAIPLLFKAKQVNGNYYTEGGIGGKKNFQGNTPITPLIKQEKCSHIIVNHLRDGSLWERHAFPDATILEIRPGSAIKRQGLVKDVLGFDANSIRSWINQGYEDTQRCFDKVGAVLSGLSLATDAKLQRDQAINRLDNDHFELS